ncbi:oligosaccharide repeat unit polymerase [Exiguobacterium sp. IPCH1]|uniref:O-antigen polymerase n=2 Tax=Exiguobacterium TaxID=33986 RepID=UPI00103C98F0|nr:O-antigen polymerase [Exiguobacterium sp. IPCI3]TCI81235.1 oligosaccharide repeat unit polymerase [Exiguobacterium sp. IPCH1]TCI82432.1 oligosaccharide repeat unit polymerase [Exiguobacterium sp. IPBC4]
MQLSKGIMINRNQIFLYLFLYKFIIELIYYYVISVKYSYSGLTLNIDLSSFWISNLLLILIILFSPRQKNRGSTYLYIIFEIFLVIPTLSYYWLNSQNTTYVSYVAISSIVISLILRVNFSGLKIKDKTSHIILNSIFLFYVFSTVYLIVLRGGIDSRAFDFDTIYSLRVENNIDGLSSYLMNWTTKAFFPFFFTYYLYKKKYIMLLPIAFLQILMYLSFGNKAFLLSIGVLILFVVAVKGNYIRNIVISMCLLHVLAYLLDRFLMFDALRTAVSYRLVFIPAQIQFQYYDFFSLRDKLYFADGIIGKILLVDSPFSESIGFVIGKYFSYNGLGSNSNTGMLADAYANGGFIAMLVIATVFGLLLNIIDNSTKELPIYVVVGSLSYIMFVLNDTALLTTILTGGLGIVIILLILFNSAISNSTNKSLENNNG